MNPAPSITGFRLRLLFGMMLVVCVVTALSLWAARQKVTSEVQQQMRASFVSEVAALHRSREIRQAALVERSRSLARKPRIHAALEDNALDLLYPNAEDELRDVMEGDAGEEHPLRAQFYRFLDAEGKVITPPRGIDAGTLSAEDEARLSLVHLPETQQVGYLIRDGGVDEIIAAPVVSTETNEVIASIVLGFKPFDISGQGLGMKSGIWTENRLFMPEVSVAARATLTSAMQATPAGGQAETTIEGTPHLLFSQLLNSASLFPPAYEVCVYSVAEATAKRQQFRWQILGAGGLLLLGAGVASHFIAGRLSMPVEELVVVSAHNVVRREKAEAALEQTNVELHRSMRFSADTSHQLKTPVTVLRAGLEELLQIPGLSPVARDEIKGLIYQTAKLASMIHDLLLLSRLDAGRLQLDLANVDLTQLIDSLADDLSALPGSAEFDVEVDVPRGLRILGDKRYASMILQNLLENAWKYNVQGGLIAITAYEQGQMLVLKVGNAGPGIPPEAQVHIFERFHRAMVCENVPGHGLGLNIARELTLLHGGDLRLLSSEAGWTEFEVSFRRAAPQAAA